MTNPEIADKIESLINELGEVRGKLLETCFGPKDDKEVITKCRALGRETQEICTIIMMYFRKVIRDNPDHEKLIASCKKSMDYVQGQKDFYKKALDFME